MSFFLPSYTSLWVNWFVSMDRMSLILFDWSTHVRCNMSHKYKIRKTKIVWQNMLRGLDIKIDPKDDQVQIILILYESGLWETNGVSLLSLSLSRSLFISLASPPYLYLWVNCFVSMDRMSLILFDWSTHVRCNMSQRF